MKSPLQFRGSNYIWKFFPRFQQAHDKMGRFSGQHESSKLHFHHVHKCIQYVQYKMTFSLINKEDFHLVRSVQFLKFQHLSYSEPETNSKVERAQMSSLIICNVYLLFSKSNISPFFAISQIPFMSLPIKIQKDLLAGSRITLWRYLVWKIKKKMQVLTVLFCCLFFAADGQVWGKYGYIDDNSVIR